MTTADRIPSSPLSSPKNNLIRSSKAHSNGNGTKSSELSVPSHSHSHSHSSSHSRNPSNTQSHSQTHSRSHSNTAQENGSAIPATTTKDVITYIFPDFHAVKYFQREFVSQNEFHIVEETTESGFDIYLVEQWVNNRKIGSIVSTYTGNSTSTVSVVKFTVIKKLARYYPTRFQEYLNELMINHAKVKVIDNVHKSEVLFVTNLTTLPPNLNLIPIQIGDLRRIEEDYVINSNLKKLHCSGRSLSLITDKVSVASEDKFRQMYKIYNVKIPVKFAIKELINLIQTSLFYFDLLDARYCDGFLCNKTEEAILNWWNLIGLPHYSIKPNPKYGILPSRTVAAIISFIISIKLRLHLVGGCDPPKDPFDFENFMISIGQFQRQYKIEKKRKLDLETLSKLFSLTNQMNGSSISNNSNNNNGSHLGNLSGGGSNSAFVDDFQSLNHTLESQLLPQSKFTNPRYNNANSSTRSLRSNTTNNSINRGSNSNAGANGVGSNLDGEFGRHNNGSSTNLQTFQNVGNGSSLSSYRKNKNYYSKEIKKLTNVVKSTVQDHIGAVNRGGDDANYYKNNSSSKSSGIKKVSELSPIEVETLDLEVLVKNFLIGKKLYRLWIGTIQSLGDQKKDRESSQVYYPAHNNNHNSALENNKQMYSFQSLRDEITSNQTILSSNGSRLEFSRYSRGLNKMKLGLQGRKGQIIRQQLLENNVNNPNSTTNNSHSEAVKNSTALVDTLLGVKSDDNGIKGGLGSALDSSDAGLNFKVDNIINDHVDKKDNNNLIDSFYFGLNRRNSFPNIYKIGELNLNMIEFGKRQQSHIQEAEDVKKLSKHNSHTNHGSSRRKSSSIGESPLHDTVSLKYRVRSNSFSTVEDFVHSTRNSNAPLETIDKISMSYLKSIYKLSNFRTLRDFTIDQRNAEPFATSMTDVDEVKIMKSYDQLNLELVKLSNVNSKMQTNKIKIVDEDLLGNLDYKIQDLVSIIDRLSYEARIVAKRINELEESSNSLDSNLTEQCVEKVNSMINIIIVSAKFNDTFSNVEERKQLLLKLTGTEEPEILNQETPDAQVSYECSGIFQFFIIFLYEIIFGIFQVLKFDRSRMNLDRIRGTWAKLDPNRTYIEKAYTLIGRKPSMSVPKNE
ncbi:hypothetical protein CLIB1423_04S02872 [[Candida] railenensis]|uniref:STB6-like N-terminal domain-containing protein n=1 Tax=[Candida] railenensis TaxID=45579 RepID=A0A9P0VWS7_9ASCO|nr:hypothetical protein CLIB1423_04S02872 [[Candida] railenensis]